MTFEQAMFWGVGGTLIVQLLLFVRAVERCKGFPWSSPEEAPVYVWLVVCLGYMMVAAFITALLFNMKQVDTPWAAFLTGIGADRTVDTALKASTRRKEAGKS
jgi:hypothetical protein